MRSTVQIPALLSLVLGLLLVGCAGLPPASFPRAVQAATPQAADAAARRGDHAQAADLYETLAAGAASGEAISLRLQAASEWLLAGRAGDAGRLVGALGGANTGSLNAEQAVWRRVLDADVALANGQTQQAWDKISGLAEPTAGPNVNRYLDARMRIAMGAARPVDSVRSEVAAERLASDAASRNEWRSRLLALLRQARERGVRLDPAASQDAVIKGWLDLGALLGSARGASLTGGSDAARWRARNPNHPAAELVAAALPAPIAVGSAATRIALLLPAAASAEARIIRDGFQFALEQLPAGARPQLQVYDTSTVPALEQLAAARAEGNSFVVGPLLRNDVATLAAGGAPAVPTLALNALPNDARGPDNLFQFALSPEDEARSTARRILADGLKRGVALSPSGEWGTRVSTAFNQEFLAGGGVLLAQGGYDPNAADYSSAIKQVLAVNESEARLRRLQSLTGTKLEFEPRRRADIEFIFAAASQPTTARMLRPQLGYQYAGDVPTYLTSLAYTAGAKEANEDLNGAMLPGMPWLLPDASLDAVRTAAQQSAAAGNWQSQYFAFGYDACQLALAIAAAGRDTSRLRVAGLTGQLTMDSGGRVRREQVWARIRDGEAQLLTDLARN